MKNILKNCLLVIVFFVFICCCSTKVNNEKEEIINYAEYIKKTKNPQKFDVDLVPNEKTAIEIANIIWSARYEGLKWYKDLPYTVVLEDNKVWYVKNNLPKGYYGKILHIKINKYDGRILYIWSEG